MRILWQLEGADCTDRYLRSLKNVTDPILISRDSYLSYLPPDALSLPPLPLTRFGFSLRDRQEAGYERFREIIFFHVPRNESQSGERVSFYSFFYIENSWNNRERNDHQLRTSCSNKNVESLRVFSVWGKGARRYIIRGWNFLWVQVAQLRRRETNRARNWTGWKKMLRADD